MKFLIVFVQDFVLFRLPELMSVASMYKIEIKFASEYSLDSPFLVVDLPSEEELRLLCSRCFLIKCGLVYFAHGRDYEELRLANQETMPILQPLLTDEARFSFTVIGFNRSLSNAEQEEARYNVHWLDFPGQVKLKNPDIAYHLYLFYKTSVTIEKSEELLGLYFGRLIAEGQNRAINKYSLKTRAFINTTSMNETLSCIMANLAQARDGSVILDPFVGTGGMLIPCAAYGGYILGSDIDYRIIVDQKSTGGHSAYANFVQYGLTSRFIDTLLADNSHVPWRKGLKFDAIVTDPPYGIRESAKKIGMFQDNLDHTIPDHLRKQHFPHRIAYPQQELVSDLLNFAAERLVVGGRLVFWMPTYEQAKDEDLPAHPAMVLRSKCEQALAGQLFRILITLEKTREPTIFWSNFWKTIKDLKAQTASKTPSESKGKGSK